MNLDLMCVLAEECLRRFCDSSDESSNGATVLIAGIILHTLLRLLNHLSPPPRTLTLLPHRP